MEFMTTIMQTVRNRHTRPFKPDKEYTAEFDALGSAEWAKILDRFDDANIYQTWSYNAVRHGEGRLSNFVLRFLGRIVSAGQLVVVKIPSLGTGAAYMRWGPLWRERDSRPDTTVFRMAVRVLRNEYVIRRGLCLRIFPAAFDDSDASLKNIMSDEGYVPSPGETAQRTLLVDITGENNQLRSNFKQKWRNCLNKAERNQLKVGFGDDDALFGKFIDIYEQLLERKRFKVPNDINQFRKIQGLLPKEHKMGVFLTGFGKSVSSGAICSAIGDTGVYLFGATSREGMKTNGSYLVQWNIIRWLKETGCRWYNLNGINPETNPGTFHFKKGVAGKTGRDIRYLGRFDSYRGSFGATLVFFANRLLKSFRNTLEAFRRTIRS